MITVDVPERITRSDLCRVVASLGMNLDDLVSLWFDRDGIHATVIARDADGKSFVTPNHELAKHDICIPLVDD